MGTPDISERWYVITNLNAPMQSLQDYLNNCQKRLSRKSHRKEKSVHRPVVENRLHQLRSLPQPPSIMETDLHYHPPILLRDCVLNLRERRFQSRLYSRNPK